VSDSAVGRDREAFLRLLALHEAQLLGFLCAIVPGFQDAEDLFQQTVLTMWQKFGDFEPGSSFVGWGCQIARFKAMNYLRAKRVPSLDSDTIEMLATTQQDEDPNGRLERRRALATCLAKLREADAAIVTAAYADGISLKDIADQLGRSAGGVANSLARIRAALYQCIHSTLAQEGHAS
jgi:RNA polymerase sigma-70 factor (ECF subfamily)